MSISILVFSACSGDKAIDTSDIACGDIDEASRSALLEEYRDVSMPARSLYTFQKSLRYDSTTVVTYVIGEY